MHVYGISTGYFIKGYFHYAVGAVLYRGLEVFLDINL